MPLDIGLAWDQALESCDLVPASAEPSRDLPSAILVSLFTDRLATPEFKPRDGNRRGWWADAYAAQPIGSRLWQLNRAKRTDAVLLAARDYCKEALAWLVDDGVASRVDVQTKWLASTAMGILVTVWQPGSPPAAYPFLWGAHAVL